MKINLKTIRYYFLTTGAQPLREKHMHDLLSGLQYTKINPPMDVPRLISGAKGHIKMLEQGIEDQTDSDRFEPYIIMEDDVEYFDEERKNLSEINVPDNADIIYIGVSSCGVHATQDHMVYCIYAKNYNYNFLRIYNMLGSHAIMICSKTGADAFIKAMEYSCKLNTYWDIPYARIQPFYNVYCPKKPIFYQDRKYGGQEGPTKLRVTKYTAPPVYDKSLNYILDQ